MKQRGAISEKHSRILGVRTYVLDDERVVITATHLQEAFGLHRRGNVPSESHGAEVPRFLAQKSINPFVSAELTTGLKTPVEFSLPQGGAVALGYDSDLLTEVALAIVQAGLRGALRHDQRKMLDAAQSYLIATSKIGARFALLDEHGLQPRSGAAAEMVEALQRELVQERKARLDTSAALTQQVQANAALSLQLSEKDAHLRTLTSGALGEIEHVFQWAMRRMGDIAMMRRYGQPMSEAQARGAVQEELRRVLGYQHQPWEEFPYGRMDELRKWLFWMHRDARKSAKRHGFQGDGAWSQPPLPFTGCEDLDDE